jgi:PTS system beta-glucosides-specific IIC component
VASASKYQTIADGVLQGVGGPENVASVTHCATRLRFQLRDRAKADKAAVEGTAGVITVVEAGGQFQVVIGNTVPNVYEALTAHGVGAGDGSEKASGGIVGKAIDLITSIFTPFLWVLAGTGLLKALLAVAVKVDGDFAATSTYAILFTASDAVIQFLPILLAITSAKRFKANVYTSVAIAAALIYTATMPVIAGADGVQLTLNAYASAGGDVTFLGIPVQMISYLSAVIPTVLAVYAQGHLERLVQKILPEVLRNFLTPLVVVAVIFPATLLAIGPVSNWIGEGLSTGVNWLWDLSPAVGGALLGGFWQVFVIFGVHWGFVPVMLNDIASDGYSVLTGALFPAVLAQAGAAFAVMLKSRNRQLKQIAGPAALSGFLAGVTEPAIYGVTLRLKKPFIYACIGGAVGGGIAAAGGSAAEGFVFPGAITIPATMNIGNFTMQLIGIGLAMAIAFTLTMVLGFKDLPEQAAAPADAAPTPAPAPAPAAADATDTARFAGPGGAATLTATRVVEVHAPVLGTAVALSEVGDAVFSSGALGSGLGIVPTSGRIVAPVDGVLASVMPHAYGLRTDDGVEVLVHVGIDTVKMDGAGFSPAVAAGDRVVAGSPLGSVDLDQVRAAGFDPTTVVLVTTTDSHDQVVPAAPGPVGPDDVVITVVA